MSYKLVLEEKGVKDLDPDQIFDCGQCFRWEKNEDGSWQGVTGCGENSRKARTEYDADAEILRVYEDREEAAAGGDDTAYWRNYFDLDRDYGAIKQFLAKDDGVMAKAIEFGSGIRILKQDRWETIVSFIISQNNNIPRIKKCIRSVAGLSGDPDGGLPGVEELAAMEVSDLDVCRLGYRSKYLVTTARQIEAEGMPETGEGLTCLCGVGPKVANCIDLFGYGNVDSFPVDVWMKRVMNQLYGIPENDVRSMKEYAAEHFAPYGGIAQQYLFYYITHK